MVLFFYLVLLKSYINGIISDSSKSKLNLRGLSFTNFL